MAKFKLFAGVDRAEYCGIYEYPNAREADAAAYDLAWEDYEFSGLLNWDDVYKNCLNSGFINPEVQTEEEIADIVNEYYIDTVESNISWWVEEV